MYTTYRGPEERKAYLADKKELKKLEKYKQRYDELAAKARRKRNEYLLKGSRALFRSPTSGQFLNYSRNEIL